MEEPEHRDHLVNIIRRIGADRLLFSTDYLHGDCDNSRTDFKTHLREAPTQAIFRDNAATLYRLARPSGHEPPSYVQLHTITL